jgi:membrane fusion protein
MSQTLFRPEAMQAGQASWLGGIRIGHNPKFSTVAAVALVLAGGLLAFAVWGQVARKARIPGVLVPEQGALQLGAQAPGVLVDLRVQDGERVAAGWNPNAPHACSKPASGARDHEILECTYELTS